VHLPERRLVKRILVVEPPHLLRFEVMDQHIGLRTGVTLGGALTDPGVRRAD